MTTHEGIGAAVRRKEDRRFLLGKGRYVDDIVLPDQTHAVFVRSMYAHARIKKVDTAAAKAADGVVGVFTGDDIAADVRGGCIGDAHDRAPDFDAASRTDLTMLW